MTAAALTRMATPCLLAIVLLSPPALAQPPSGGAPAAAPAQTAPRTPLEQDTLARLANEVSGQMAYDNLVRLAGAPWQRDRREFSGTLDETQRVHDLVRSYGIDTVRIDQSAGTRTIEYPRDAEFWVMQPGPRLVARLGADAALVASGSQTSDVTGELVFVPPMSEAQVKQMAAAGAPHLEGKVGLMWAHPRGEAAKALDEAGLLAVVSFGAQDRYLDPNQVLYSGGAYAGNTNLKLGLSVSWRQWTELLEDVQAGRKPIVRCKAAIESVPDKFEAVYTWIPGTEPDAKGVIFTAHLFEGFVKRGANDNMSGVVVQLEILRALNRLIATGQIPRPRRTIHFLWPVEISGTYEWIRQHPGISDRFSVNINMDMVGEWLRENNSWFTMSECPSHLPCFFDGLAKSVMNYVWRTNDIVYLPDAPRGRSGGQYFPAPLVEKNGSTDAFRFFIHRGTGGSDHVCFNNPTVAVPGIEWFTWPDQWYHADADKPDKADPTEMKRVAFIGAASALVASDLTDRRLAGLLDAVSEFGYARLAERDLPRALGYLEQATPETLAAQRERALNVTGRAVDREAGALQTVGDVFTGSAAARTALANRLAQWELYRAALAGQVEGYFALRARQLGVSVPTPLRSRPAGRAAGKPPADASLVPAIDASVRGREFALGSNAGYGKLMQEPASLEAMGLSRAHAGAILNWVNGKRTTRQIRDAVSADSGEEVSLEAVVRYLRFLESIRWVRF